MNTAPRKNVIVPGFPPAPVPTLMYSFAGLVLSFVATGIYSAAQFFKLLGDGAYLVANLYCLLALVPIAVLSFLFGLKALKNENQRKWFQWTVWEYTRKTNDTRYMPYILPVHTTLVTSIFVISIIIPCISPLICGLFLNGRM